VPDDEDRKMARLRAIKDALALGAECYDGSGRLLETPAEVLACLQREGGVMLVPPNVE
jgi:hypothetical protein